MAILAEPKSPFSYAIIIPMKRMSLTMAFFIALIVILWFFGMTLFNMKPLASGFNAMVANVLATGRYEARVGEQVIDAKDGVHKTDVAKLCTSAILRHSTEHVVCYWRGEPLPGVGLLGH